MISGKGGCTKKKKIHTRKGAEIKNRKMKQIKTDRPGLETEQKKEYRNINVIRGKDIKRNFKNSGCLRQEPSFCVVPIIFCSKNYFPYFKQAILDKDAYSISVPLCKWLYLQNSVLSF